MRYLVERNFVRVVGKIWMPSTTAATEYPLTKYDLENIGEFTRENVEEWLTSHSGDFRAVTDFYATAGDVEIHWKDEDSESVYNDCMFPSED